MASCFVAVRFRDGLAAALNVNVFVALLILYVGTSLVIWIIFRFVSRFIDRMKLKEFDRQIGAIFGFAKGGLLCAIITLFAVTLLGDEQRKTIIESRSGYYIAKLLDKSHSVISPELHDRLHPYIHSLDERLDPAGGQRHKHDAEHDHGTQHIQLVPIEDFLHARDPERGGDGFQR